MLRKKLQNPERLAALDTRDYALREPDTVRLTTEICLDALTAEVVDAAKKHIMVPSHLAYVAVTTGPGIEGLTEDGEGRPNRVDGTLGMNTAELAFFRGLLAPWFYRVIVPINRPVRVLVHNASDSGIIAPYEGSHEPGLSTVVVYPGEVMSGGVPTEIFGMATGGVAGIFVDLRLQAQFLDFGFNASLDNLLPLLRAASERMSVLSGRLQPSQISYDQPEKI